MSGRGGADQIEIVGRACRLPGAPTIRKFWDNLSAARCTVGAIGEDRWRSARFRDARPGQPGKSYTFAAGTIDTIWSFDPAAFGIAPREAVQMDPQQRLGLQLVWEALEDALIPSSKLARQCVGVYAGASALDYSTSRMLDTSSADAYFMTGNTLSLISNRISHVFDLRGPSLTIDTACSSSLVALHHAVEALRAGHIEMAIVLGVNALLSPFPFVGFAQAGMLSRQGLCRAFDANADGYVRAEGGVALVLMRSDARLFEAPRHYARVLATAINADGRTMGASLPSYESQAALLQAAYLRGGIDPESLAFVEAHGTGTRVGDPVEARALGEVLGRRRSRPLPIGSVKSNIGHLEPASGLAGVLKAVLALENHFLPATLHVDQPNPDIAFDALNLQVAREPAALGPAPVRLAGISSFGFGGANAHVVISDPRVTPETREAGRVSVPGWQRPDCHAGIVVLSGMSQEAVKALAKRHLENVDASFQPSSLAATLAHHRDRMPERAVVVAATPEHLRAALAAIAEGRNDPLVIRGRALGRAARVAFVFAGNGSQWAGMGSVALGRNAAFRAKLAEIDKIFAAYADWSPADALVGADLGTRLAHASCAQPLLFAVQVAVVAAMRALGLAPDLVLGHSVGELAAAHVAGALSLEQAVAVVAARSGLQEQLKGKGAMLAAKLSPQAALTAMVRLGASELEVAASNSPQSVTLAGPRGAIERFARLAVAEGIRCKVLELDYPFHSRLLNPLEQPFLSALEGMHAAQGDVPFISTVTGDTLEGSLLRPDYWWRNMRAPVRFDAAIAAARHSGAQLFVEIGPRPILQAYMKECLARDSAKIAVIPSLDRDDCAAVDPIIRIAATAIACGAQVDEARAFGGPPQVPAQLPGYPWQALELRPPATVEATGWLVPEAAAHPLLGWQDSANDTRWHVHIDTENMPWLAQHRVDGNVVFPGAGFAEIALAAARRWLAEERVEVRDLRITQPLVLRQGETSELRIEIAPAAAMLEIASRPRLSDQDFRVHAVCRLARLSGSPDAALAPNSDRPCEVVAAETAYRIARSYGLDYGPEFRRLARVHRIDAERLDVVFIEPAGVNEPPTAFGLHPIDLDAAFHALFLLAEGMDAPDSQRAPLVPVRFGELRLWRAGRRAARARLVAKRLGTRTIQADVAWFDGDGGCIAALDDARFAALRLTSKPRLASVAYFDAWKMRARTSVPASRRMELRRTARQPFSTHSLALPSEPKLLLEAAACRIAYDRLCEVADPHSRLVVPAGSRGDNALALLLRALLEVLQGCGLAEETASGWQLEGSCQLPPAATLLRTVLAEHPAWSADCVLLNRASTLLAERLRGAGSDQQNCHTPWTLDHFHCASPRFSQALDGLTVPLEALARDPHAWPRRVCMLGFHAGLARKLAALAQAHDWHIAIAEPDKRLLESARQRYAHQSGMEVIELAAGAGGLADREPYDLMVSAFAMGRLLETNCLDDVATALAADGLFLGVEAAPDAFHTVVFGVEPGWFCRSPLPAYPTGRLRSPGEWVAAVQRAGLIGVEAVPVGAEPGDTALLVAEAPPAAACPASQPIGIEGGGDLYAQTPILLHAALEDALAEQLACELRRLGKPIVCHFATNGHAASTRACSADGALNVSTNDSPASARQPTRNGDDARAEEIVWSPAVQTALEPSSGAILVQQIAALRHLLLSSRDAGPRRLWLLLPGGARSAPAGGQAKPLHVALWAFARTAANELAPIDIRLVDIDARLSPEQAGQRLAPLLMHPPPDREILIAPDGVLGLRVCRGSPPGRPRAMRPDKAELAVLAQREPGSIEALGWLRRPSNSPEAGQVAIEVAASGLNFRDVMGSVGLLSEEALEAGLAGSSLGFECAGTISAVGPGVEDFHVGDRVVALAPQALASHVLAPARLVLPVPAFMDLTAAATIPVAFLTAYYSLQHAARLDPGEWLLVHGGAGAVGLAALQIARWRGARVIATAGTEEKREFLKLLGAEHVLSSRSLEFFHAVKRLTKTGVDVVLNSLSGAAMERSLELLKPFGRFLELGKRDFYAGTRLELRPLRHNITYFAVDVDQLLVVHPELAAALARELMQLFADQLLQPLPYRLFEAGDVVDAFRLMQQSGHIGKIVIRPPRPASPVAAAPERRFAPCPDGFHVIIGGLGGFGLATAEWLADRGARRLVLVGRRGQTDAAGRHLIDDLRSQAVDVRTVACDAADPGALKACLEELRSERPIKGIVHAAMVLEDALLANFDAAQFERVLRSKADVADALDVLTCADQLDYFWLYSSVASLVGNPGQAAYAAANGYLEGLARVRRANGLPALAVRWGAIDDTGVLVRTAHAAGLARRPGVAGLKARQALDLLEQAICRDDGAATSAVITLASTDWEQVHPSVPLLRTSLFEQVITPGDLPGAGAVDLRSAIEALGDTDAVDLVTWHLSRELAAILRAPADEIDRQRPMSELGLDSLMVVELRLAVAHHLGIDLPLASIGDDTSLSTLAVTALAALRSGPLAAGPATFALESDLAQKHLDVPLEHAALVHASQAIDRRAAANERVIQ